MSRKKGDKPYTKWAINLPDEMIKKAGFKQGDQIKVSVKNKKLILKKQ